MGFLLLGSHLLILMTQYLATFSRHLLGTIKVGYFPEERCKFEVWYIFLGKTKFLIGIQVENSRDKSLESLFYSIDFSKVKEDFISMDSIIFYFCISNLEFFIFISKNSSFEIGVFFWVWGKEFHFYRFRLLLRINFIL